jgi:hypothetical protein
MLRAQNEEEKACFSIVSSLCCVCLCSTISYGRSEGFSQVLAIWTPRLANVL